MTIDAVMAPRRALAELQHQWRQLVRALYLEATNDVAGAESLSIDAMRGEILDRVPPRR